MRLNRLILPCQRDKKQKTKNKKRKTKMIMTPSQKKKWLRSEEFYCAGTFAYPYGFDESTEADWEKITLVDAKRHELETSFRTAQDAARDDWRNADSMDALCAYDSAYSNAVDTHRDGLFAFESVSFWSCALSGALMHLEGLKK